MVDYASWLLIMSNRDTFTPHNTLGSKKLPDFRHQTTPRIKHDFQQPRDRSKKGTLDLPSPKDQSNTSSAAHNQGYSLSDLGDSSSLFAYKTPPSLDFTGSAAKPANSDPPIPFVFGGLKKDPGHSDSTISHSIMVNERSPAKAPLQPVEAKDPAEAAYPAKAPQFGQPTLPQSPLHRVPPKESNVFIQPKARPEHHRDGAKPGQ